MSDKEAIKEIEAYLGKNDYKKTLELANIFLKRNPDNNLVFLYKGSALFWLKKYPEAIEIYTEAATKRLPDKPHSWRFLARCYKVQEMYKEAIKYYEISLEKDPKYESSLKELEFCYREIKDYKNAIRINKSGTEFHPKLLYHWYWLSYSYLKNQDLPNAFTYFFKAQKLYPRDKKVNELFNMLQEEYYRKEKHKQKIITIEDIEKVISKGNLELKNKGISTIDNIGLLDIIEDYLERLNLANNNIEKISGLDNHIKLSNLDLSGNQIKKIEGLESLKQLEKLNLSNNQIIKIVGLSDLYKLEYLNLAGNQITSLKELTQMKSLKELDLRNNKLRDIGNFELLINLTSVDLSNNPDLRPFLATHYYYDAIVKLKQYSLMTDEQLREIERKIDEAEAVKIKAIKQEKRKQFYKDLDELKEKTKREGYFGSRFTSNYGSKHNLRKRLEALLKLNESGCCLYCTASLPDDENFVKECAKAISKLIEDTRKTIPIMAKSKEPFMETRSTANISNRRMDAYGSSGSSNVTTRTKHYSETSVGPFFNDHFPKLEGVVCKKCSDELIKKSTSLFKRLQRRRYKRKHFAHIIQKEMKSCHEDYMKLYETFIEKRGY